LIAPEGLIIRARTGFSEQGIRVLNQEWTWVAAVVAIPVVLFGAAEMVALMRRRRYEAIARRPKDPRRRSGRDG
jgi:hypothetical protein